MKAIPVGEAGARLGEFFGVSPGTGLESLVAGLRLVDDELAAVAAETRFRAAVGVIGGVMLTQHPPRCLTAQLLLGDLSVHLGVLPPRYFVGAQDDLWRVQVDAYLACGHEEHDIDPVLELRGRTADSPAGAVEGALALARELRVEVPSWNLTAEYWHARLTATS